MSRPGPWLCTLVFGFSSACGSSVPTPPRAQHHASNYVEVPYPPPAALAETVPEAPNASAVWVDGEWLFQGRVYVWERGGWVLPPSRASHALWRFYFKTDGRLLLAPGTWYDASGRPIEAPEPVVPAATPSNEFTPERATAR